MDDIVPICKIKLENAKQIIAIEMAYDLGYLIVGCWNIPEVLVFDLAKLKMEGNKNNSKQN